MKFLKDFENEIKIFFVLVSLIMLAGWFGALTSFSFSQKAVREEQRAVQQEEAVQEQQPKEQAVQEPEESIQILQYANESLGISFLYPAEWFVYDEVTWEKDNAIESCQTKGVIENTVILSKKDLGRCVGVEEFHSWPGDFLVSFSESEWKKFPFIIEAENPDFIEVGETPTARYLFGENSSNERKQAVRLYANTNQRGYIIEFTQQDAQGTYEKVFDQILATFQWL